MDINKDRIDLLHNTIHTLQVELKEVRELARNRKRLLQEWSELEAEYGSEDEGLRSYILRLRKRYKKANERIVELKEVIRTIC